MADPSLVPLRKARPSPTSQTILREQAGHELVFAIVGHIGSGVSHTAEMLKTALEDATLPGGRFDVTLLKARDQIVEWAVRTDRTVPKTGPRDVETITALQDLGDEMRGAGDHAAVANALIRKIRLVRAQKQGVAELEKTAAVIPDGTRRAFILDSIRHPMEVQHERRRQDQAGPVQTVPRRRASNVRACILEGPRSEGRCHRRHDHGRTRMGIELRSDARRLRGGRGAAVARWSRAWLTTSSSPIYGS